MSTRLGRGLEALIPISTETDDKSLSISSVRLEKIHPNPYQPRHRFDEEKLQELSNSLKENGMIQPVIVTKRMDSEYELIAGERRLEAAKLAGFTEIPVIIRSVSPQEQLQYALIENIQRENLNPIEEAKAYNQLSEEFSLTHNEIAQLMGKERTTITNSIRLLKLPEPVQDHLSEGRISPGHARAILQLEEENQVDFAAKVIDKAYSVRETEKQAKRIIDGLDKKKLLPNQVESQQIKDLSTSLEEKYAVKVNVKPGKKGGTISFKYKSEKELQNLIKSLLG
ncbi:MAG: ParB/RepB/Spo0J family partition protein [Candidatus Cloacimonas sp.]|nr:ParB/RepB/Spo0J family partition protein [Candidatus Cloacimonadota bacterium]